MKKPPRSSRPAFGTTPPEEIEWVLGTHIPNADILFAQIPWTQNPNDSSYPFIDAQKNFLAVFNGLNKDLYVDKNDTMAVAESVLKALVERPDFADDLNENIVRWCDRLIGFARRVAATDLTALSNSELYGVYQEHDTVHTKLYTYGWQPVVVDIFFNNFTDHLKKYLYGACATPEEAEEAFVILTTPREKSIIAVEREELMRVAGSFWPAIKEVAAGNAEPPDRLRKALERHAEKWGHLGYVYAGNVEPFAAGHYLKELTDMAEAGATPAEVLAREERQLAEAKEAQERLYEKLDTPPAYQRLFAAAQGFALTKLLRRHAQLLALLLLHTTLIREIAQRLGLDRFEVQSMLNREVKGALAGGPIDRGLLAERLKHCVLYTGKGFEEVYVGSAAERFTKCVVQKVDMTVTELKGQTARRGKARGIVKLIARAADIGKMNDGDILVSVATDPDVVPAMKKAGAIVTDQGGITAHAAIVSRELGKPCVIGTKIATQVLKDGDLVEVDADKGIVTILKRA